MKKLFALVSLIGALMPLSTQAQQSSGTLAGFLFGQGLAGAKLERRFGNHLFVPVSINNKPAALMMSDASRPWSRGSERVSDGGAGRVERIGRANVKVLAIGGFTTSNAETTEANISGEVLPSKTAPESNAGLLRAERLAFNFAIID